MRRSRRGEWSGSAIVGWWDQHQVGLYLVAIVIGAGAGLLAPDAGAALEPAINPVLAALLFATFLGIPLTDVGRAFRDVRFLATVLLANFLLVPLFVFALSRLIADDRGLLVGVLLALLTPCIDYVIVFTGLAGGARDRLLAATPMLMLGQILLLPLYLWLFAGADVVAVIEVQPFVLAFLILIVLPLTAAAVVQGVARRHRAGRAVHSFMTGAMVPLMMITLAVIIGSQIAAVGGQAVQLLRLLPIYIAFAVIAVVLGRAAGAVARLDVPSARAAIFSVTTRNSLVVLPLALALPADLGMAPLAVVTQTLVELVTMVALVRVVPVLVR